MIPIHVFGAQKGLAISNYDPIMHDIKMESHD